MGSVGSYMECPNCGYEECHSEYYYKSHEEYVNCMRCGYRASVELKRDPNGNAIRINGELQYEESELKKPYGCLTYRVKDSIATGVLSLESKKELDDILHQISKDTETVVVELKVSRWVGGRRRTTDFLKKQGNGSRKET